MNVTSHRANRTTRPFRERSRAAVGAFALLGLVQLFVSAVVPFAEARTPSGLGAHIERPSERRHYVHDEAYCAACIARHIPGTAPASSPPADRRPAARARAPPPPPAAP